jgi:hypothetical protein
MPLKSQPVGWITFDRHQSGPRMMANRSAHDGTPSGVQSFTEYCVGLVAPTNRGQTTAIDR